MKILLLTSGILPDTHSGIAKVAYYTGRELCESGHQVVVLTRRYKEHHAVTEEINGMHYYRIPYPDRWGVFHVTWPLVAAVKSWIWQKRIHRIHPDVDAVWILNQWWTLLLNPRKLWPRAKLICQFYGNPYDEITANNGKTFKARLFARLYMAVSKQCMRLSHYVAMPSQFAYDDAVAMMGANAQKKLVLIPHGVDVDCYRTASSEEKQDLKKKLQLPHDRPIFITARGLKRRTGVDKLITAASLLKKEGFLFYLVVIGKGPMKEAIQQQIQALRLDDSVTLLSDLSEEKLAAYYRASDVFVLPTQAAEAFGLATIEAIAAGLVAFGTNNGATPEILNRYQPEWIIPGSDEKSIYHKMKEFCRDPQKFTIPYEDMKAITAKHYSWTSAAKKFAHTCSH